MLRKRRTFFQALGFEPGILLDVESLDLRHLLLVTRQFGRFLDGTSSSGVVIGYFGTGLRSLVDAMQLRKVPAKHTSLVLIDF